jgi:hypothetical protein
MCGTPSIADGPVTNASMPTPRRTATPAVSLAAFANTHSVVGRRPVTNRNRSSSGRGSTSMSDGGNLSNGAHQTHPASTS